jgi:hypothetical protein
MAFIDDYLSIAFDLAILVNVNGDSGERERLNGVLCWCGWFLLHVFTLGQVFLVFRIVSPVNLMV